MKLILIHVTGLAADPVAELEGRTLPEAAAEHSAAYLHVDLAAHFEHPEDPEAHLRTFAALDTDLVAPVLEEVWTSAEAVRLVLLGTWRETQWQERPPALYGAWPPMRVPADVDAFTEAALREEGLAMSEPGRLLREATAAG